MSEILRVENLKKYFDTSGGKLHAVDDVSFTIEEATTLGVVGESGCGKSTLGRTVLGLIPATEGKVIFDGEDVTHVSKKRQKELCADMQIIFQDPYSSLDPRMCVFDLIADPLQVFHTYKSKAELTKRVRELMDVVGLARRMEYSYPHEMDGGRRQRVVIARAIALNPRFVVCDEPVSALDVSIQAQVLNLLMDLQDMYHMTYIFISHDMSVIKHISDNIMVMYMGCAVEKASKQELFKNPIHPYTNGLLSAIPVPNVHRHAEKIIMKGEITSPIEPAPGCRFAPRCKYATDICRKATPELKEVSPDHFVACHNCQG